GGVDHGSAAGGLFYSHDILPSGQGCVATAGFPGRVWEGYSMQIQMLKVGILQTNCYLVWDTCTRDCAVIDPGGEAPRILEAIQTQSLEVRAYLLTHAHFDHFRALWPMYEAYPAPAYVGKEDLDPLVNP